MGTFQPKINKWSDSKAVILGRFEKAGMEDLKFGETTNAGLMSPDVPQPRHQ
jgi:hypothetical protein